MSSNVGLSTPRGSGTSGYVQRNYAFMKPRNAGYGAPYPPASGSNSFDADRGFKQRQPDKQILEHDRLRAIEVKVLEERERLEEENERIEEELELESKKNKGRKDDMEEGEETEKKKNKKKVLSDEEIDERCEALRQKLLKEMEQEKERSERGGAGGGKDDRRRGGRDRKDLPPRERKQFKAYQVHELAEAKIEESERLRRALGIRDDWESPGANGNREKGRDSYEGRRRD